MSICSSQNKSLLWQLLSNHPNQKNNPKKFQHVLEYRVTEMNKNRFKFNNDFFIDRTLNFRFHYPFENEKKSKLTREIFRSLNLDNFKSAEQEFDSAKRISKSYKLDESDKSKIKYFCNKS